jgi:hypothetical protein
VRNRGACVFLIDRNGMVMQSAPNSETKKRTVIYIAVYDRGDEADRNIPFGCSNPIGAVLVRRTAP